MIDNPITTKDSPTRSEPTEYPLDEAIIISLLSTH